MNSFKEWCEKNRLKKYRYSNWNYAKEKGKIHSQVKDFTLEELEEAKLKLECTLPLDKGIRLIPINSMTIALSAVMLSLLSISSSFIKDFANMSVTVSGVSQPASVFLMNIITYFIFGMYIFTYLVEVITAIWDKKIYRTGRLKLDIINEFIASKTGGSSQSNINTVKQGLKVKPRKVHSDKKI